MWLTAFPVALPLLTRDQTSDAIAGAVAVWSKQDPTVGACSYLDLRLLVAGENETQPTGNDGTNSIGIRQDTWCPHPPNCYDPSALALTTVSARASTGEILDADIEVNAVIYSWADVTRGAPTGSEQDLQSALAHEMGHLIGLDHTCSLGGGNPRPTDQNGNPIPDCLSASGDVRDTTMFADEPPLDTGKRTLAPDDVMGVCAIYPLLLDPMSCPPPGPLDAGVDGGPVDAGLPDAQGDDAVGDSESASKKGGCGCDVPSSGPSAVGIFLIAILLVLRKRSRDR